MKIGRWRVLKDLTSYRLFRWNKPKKVRNPKTNEVIVKSTKSKVSYHSSLESICEYILNNTADSKVQDSAIAIIKAIEAAEKRIVNKLDQKQIRSFQICKNYCSRCSQKILAKEPHYNELGIIIEALTEKKERLEEKISKEPEASDLKSKLKILKSTMFYLNEKKGRK